MFKRSLIILGTVVLLQGCAAAVVAGTASAVMQQTIDEPLARK